MLEQLRKRAQARFLEIQNYALRVGCTPAQADRVAKILTAATFTKAGDDIDLTVKRLFPSA